MKKIVLQTLNETKQLAKKLEGNTAIQTIQNIKSFVYWHIQYLQDNETQQLYSPARTWQMRATGVDCKSFSIIVSSVLTNLNIKNSFRQIKQMSYAPENWTHVYVFLPDFDCVIDGTVLYDQEPLYIQYYDEPVLSNGLAGLSISNNNNNNWCNINKQNSCINLGDDTTQEVRLPLKDLKELLSSNDSEIQTNQVRNNRSSISDLSAEIEAPKSLKKHLKQSYKYGNCGLKKHLWGLGVFTAIVVLFSDKKEKPVK